MTTVKVRRSTKQLKPSWLQDSRPGGRACHSSGGRHGPPPPIHDDVSSASGAVEARRVDARLEHASCAVLGFAHVLLDVGSEKAEVVRKTTFRLFDRRTHVNRSHDAQVRPDNTDGVRLAGDILVFDLEEAPVKPLPVALGVTRFMLTQSVTAEERFHGGGTLPKDRPLDSTSITRQNPAVILDLVRTSLHRAITTPVGESFAPVRIPKDLARRLNVTLGQPLCSSDELTRRRAATERLASLRTGRGEATPAASGTSTRVAAPVVVYFEKDRNARELGRVEEVLKAKAIAYQRLDVAGDEATLAFVMRTAGCKEDELPVVFVAGAAIGGYRELVAADVSGALAKAIYG